ncbi:MAG: hypothetical protein J0L82_08380 [Deltaproteobacteria bacterium]|nr:hypothetical protein [Deltaproteobacteria bacterium]
MSTSGKIVSNHTGASKSLAAEIDRLKYDKRLIDLNVSRKRLTKDELKKHLDSLPDLADNVIRVELDNENLN